MRRLFGGQEEPKGKRGEVMPQPNEGLPDSRMPAGLCPRCGKQSSFENAGSLPITYDELYSVGREGQAQPEQLDRVTSLICRHCHHGVAVVEERWVGEQPARVKQAGGVITYRGVHWWPLPGADVRADVPSEIASAFTEAVAALHAGCPRASAVMARRTIEAVSFEQGETSGRLADRLEALAKRGVLVATLADWAKEVRLVGNAGAHFDPIEEVSTNDARELVRFTRELLRYLYELPADLARRRTEGSPSAP